jgi:sugar-specific transcriptional regulator TrmB
MNIVNGKEREVVEMLRGHGLNCYEAKAYFALLVTGESKVGQLARKSSVPQSKIYEILESLNDKGFVELVEDERPVVYKAINLKDTTEKAIAAKNKDIKQLQKNVEKLNRVVEAVAPIHRQYEAYRLFAPRYRTWKKDEAVAQDYEPTLSTSVISGHTQKNAVKQ